MRAFDELLRQEIAVYEGRHDDLIYLAPDLYRLLTCLLDDPQLTMMMFCIIIRCTAFSTLLPRRTLSAY